MLDVRETAPRSSASTKAAKAKAPSPTQPLTPQNSDQDFDEGRPEVTVSVVRLLVVLPETNS